MKTILSLCIPTYNRAELLRSALLSVVPQLTECGYEVEIVVSDNCSPDNTKEVVEWAQQFGPIRYHRNADNIGAARNALFVVNELARGEFSWILGDDDFVRPGALKRIVEIIKKYPEIDFVFVSLCHITLDQLKNYPAPVSSNDLPAELPPDNQIGEDRYVEKWEQLVDPKVSGVFLGATQVSVFRRTPWCEHSKKLIIDKAFSSLESTYPHVIAMAHCMMGKKAYYIGTPQVIVVDGAREWFDFVPMIILVRLNEVIDLYEQVGVPKEQIERCRKHLISESGSSIIKMLLTPRIPGREYVSKQQFFSRYWHFKELWLSLVRAIMMMLIPTRVWDFIKKSMKGIRSRVQ